ncbi:barstar family protein [Streptomyces sp. KLMMK]|uniref:barstar family protein n=1 Tax=Streptomyces sp. KLMMK TaxID=3109353 RepID=UPI0030081187
MVADVPQLWSASGPWIHVLGRAAVGTVTDVLPPTGVAFVGRVDGANMADRDGVFEQFWDRLTFPDYFGWNWYALYDCLRDLKWLPANRYLVLIDNAPMVLSESPEEREAFFSVLKRAVEHWRNPHEKPGNIPVAFTVLLVCESDEAESLRAELARVG